MMAGMVGSLLVLTSVEGFDLDLGHQDDEAGQEISCMCGQYRYSLSNLREDKLTRYHCDNATKEEEPLTCNEDGCYGTCKTHGYCFKSIKRNETHVIKTFDCVKDKYLINRPGFQCETHPSNEKHYVNGCCKEAWCSANLTLNTSKMFERDENKELMLLVLPICVPIMVILMIILILIRMTMMGTQIARTRSISSLFSSLSNIFEVLRVRLAEHQASLQHPLT